MGNIPIDSLSNALQSVRAQVDCLDCPPERNCCNLTRSYSITFSEYQLSRMFGESNISELVKKDVLDPVPDSNSEQNYEMISTCPGLEDGLCIFHDQKEVLELKTCMEFPIQLVMCEVKINDDINIFPARIYVKYHCYSLEKNWESVSESLMAINTDFKLPVIVNYYDKGGVIIVYK